MEDPRMTNARVVVRECLWGDYHITAKELVDRLVGNEPGFNRFLFSRIMENSPYPFRHIRALFHPDTWRVLLDRYLKNARNTKRVRLVAANLTGNYALATENQWRL